MDGNSQRTDTRCAAACIEVSGLFSCRTFSYPLSPFFAMSALNRLVLTLPPDHSPEDADALHARLALCVSHGWEEQSLPTGEFRCIVHSALPEFCVEIVREVRGILPEISLEESAVEEKNWAEAWKEFFTPVEGGAHFLVLAPWMHEERKALAD